MSVPPIHLVGAILQHDENILLGLRSSQKRSCPNRWDVIGGHVEPGESLIEALARELLEEIAISPTEFAPLPAMQLSDDFEGPTILHLFRVTGWVGQPRIANDEHSEIRWFKPDEAAMLQNLAAGEYRHLFEKL